MAGEGGKAGSISGYGLMALMVLWITWQVWGLCIAWMTFLGCLLSAFNVLALSITFEYTIDIAILYKSGPVFCNVTIVLQW